MKPLDRSTLARLVAPAVHTAPLDAVDAVLGGFGASLPPHARRHLAHAVDLPALPALHQRAARPIASVDDLVGQVVVETGTTSAKAHEATIIVAGAIAASWGADDARVLTAALPPALLPLFTERPNAEAVHREEPGFTRTLAAGAGATIPLATGAAGSRSSLADGAPGSSRPLASAAPRPANPLVPEDEPARVAPKP